MSKQTFTQAFNDVKDSDDAISADQLRDLIEDQTERSLDSKTIRAHLRKIQARDQSQLKNARWRIDKTLAEQVVKHYSKQASKAS